MTSIPAAVRYKFGPRIDGTYPRPAVEGELPDVEVSASVAAVRPAEPGLIDMDVAFAVPAYDATQFNLLAEVHAIAYPAGHGIPTDAKLAVAAAQPKGSADASGHTAGGELVVTIPGAAMGKTTVITVLGFQDATPMAAPTDPTSIAPTDPTTAPATTTPATS